MRFVKKDPCAECPFRKTSMRGWLGPETVESIHEVVHGEYGWSCHMSISGKPTDDQGRVDTRVHGHACTGAIISATLSHKEYRGGQLAGLQREMDGHPATPEIMDAWEFREHHNSVPKKRKTSNRPARGKGEPNG